MIKWGETISIVIEARLPPDIPREHFSVAFSIKDLKGTDLIVSTTHDYERLDFTSEEAIKVVSVSKTHWLQESTFLSQRSKIDSTETSTIMSI